MARDVSRSPLVPLPIDVLGLGILGESGIPQLNQFEELLVRLYAAAAGWLGRLLFTLLIFGGLLPFTLRLFFQCFLKIGEPHVRRYAPTVG